jgi:hypothetical protein
MANTDGVEIHKGAVSKRREGKSSLVETLNGIHSELNYSFNLYLEYKKGSRKTSGRWPVTGSFEEFTQMVAGLLESGEKTDELELDNYFEFCTKQGSDYLLTPIVLAAACCMDSQRAFESGDIEKAWSCIKEAKRFAEEASEAYINEVETRQEIAKAGGIASSGKQYGTAKAQVIKLIETKRPVGGWKRPLAIEVLSNELWPFIKNEKIDLDYSELPSLLKRWITKDSAVKAVYDANSFETLSKQK